MTMICDFLMTYIEIMFQYIFPGLLPRLAVESFLLVKRQAAITLFLACCTICKL